MIEVLKQALEALKDVGVLTDREWQAVHKNKANELRQAIAELESQKPVAWMDADGNLFSFVWNVGVQQGSKYLDETLTPLYTHPPQRTWVGLTDEEMQAIWNRYAHMEMMRAIEAKLKQKNGYAEEENT
jgi:hypothetical protein